MLERMNQLARLPMSWGAAIMDTAEGWTLALIGLVVALDLWLGLKSRIALVFNVIQVGGLVAGFFWTIAITRQNDIAGPYVWAFVIGIWSGSAFLFHLWFFLDEWICRDAPRGLTKGDGS
ncbi:hypothetical protein [Paracoccus marinaquae]|uniref:Holin n=1 Tax=Paracoccus marinaquae TaxID=2841926 RepID=A0ABS6AL19_9RHOB|nr:hypothetical protein [Paracoccus marinaquae]MBU3030807.1 hypothetical protein [Paracoccus marinaquae]